MPHAPRFDRTAALTALAGRRFDVLVVGGGITGAGVALDAASRGLSTALVERDDFASGTSSASSKLVHGGLRYVSQGELGLVAQALAERQRLLSNAPHLVRALPFVLPLTGGAAAARSVGTALWLYDLAGGARIGQVHRRLSLDETRARVPALRADAFRRAYLYLDAHADDARLTLTVVRTAVLDHGAVAANHTAVVGLLRNRAGRVVGARVVADGQEIEVRAAVVVNAAGVWSDEVGGLEDDGRRGPPPSARPRASTSPCAGRGCRRRPRPCSRWPPTGARSSSSPGPAPTGSTSAPPTPTTTATSTGPVLGGRRRLPAGRGQPVPGRPPHAGRRGRMLGRAATAGGGRGFGRRAHGRPVPPPPAVGVSGRSRHHHRRQAHDLPEDGRRHRRPRGRHPGRRRPQPHDRLAPARGAGGGLAGRPRCPAPSQHWSGPAAAPTCASGRRRPEGGPPGTAPSRAWYGTW